MYNGIEYEDTHGMYEMGARQYDPTLARWVVIDPVIHHSLSPYNAFDNNPVFWADPSGADGIPNYIAAAWNATPSGTNSTWYNNNEGSFSSNTGWTMDTETLDFINNGEWLPNINITGYRNQWGRVGLGKLSTYFGGHLYAHASTYAHLRSERRWNAVHETLDMVGFVDPTGISDGINAGLYAGRGNYIMAGISAAAILPFGDLAKGVKFVGGKKGAYSVYHGLNDLGEVAYVGITKRNPTVRFGEHLNSIGTGKEFLRYDVIEGSLMKTEARIIEQKIINQYGLQKNGGQLLNNINSIAPKYWFQYGL